MHRVKKGGRKMCRWYPVVLLGFYLEKLATFEDAVYGDAKIRTIVTQKMMSF